MCSAAAEKILDLIFPPAIYCLNCGRPVDGRDLYSLCGDCLSEIKWANGKLCRLCGKLLEDWYPDDICGECRNSQRSFDAGISCFQYSDMERSMIRDLKYHGKSYMARSFSEMIYDKVRSVHEETEKPFDLIIPVPMYPAKEKKRGYNQAALLAKYTAKKLDIPFRNDILLRTKNTAPMNRLGIKERNDNLKGAFRMRYGTQRFVKDSHILLVDDIYTTGATSQACSLILKQAGAKCITVLSLASGRNQRILPDLSAYSNDKDIYTKNHNETV